MVLLTYLRHLYERINYDESQKYVESVLLIYKAFGERTHRPGFKYDISKVIGPAIGTQYSIADSLHNTNKALKVALERFQLHDEVCAKQGSVDRGLSIAANYLGLQMINNNQYEEGEKYVEQSILVRKSLPGCDKASLWSPRVSLAISYASQGRNSQAAEIFSELLADRVITFKVVDDKQGPR